MHFITFRAAASLFLCRRIEFHISGLGQASAIGIPPNHNLAPQINGVELIQVHTPSDWSWSKQIFSVVVGKLVHCKGRTIIFLFGIYFLILIQIMLRISFEVHVL